jgi:hypothetical protein
MSDIESRRTAAIDSAKWWLNQMTTGYAASIKLVEEFPDDMPGIFDIGTTEVNITIPRTIKDLRQVRRCLSKMGGWKREGAREQTWGTISITYRRPPVKEGVTSLIRVTMGLEGSNCRRVQVGTETVERPIYKVICEEG